MTIRISPMASAHSPVYAPIAMNNDLTEEVRDDAFHITAAANMAAILADSFRTDRRGVLGRGAYFDVGNETTGLAPARQRYPDQPLVIFRCEVSLGKVLDLDEEGVRTRFRQFQRQLAHLLGREAHAPLGPWWTSRSVPGGASRRRRNISDSATDICDRRSATHCSA